VNIHIYTSTYVQLHVFMYINRYKYHMYRYKHHMYSINRYKHHMYRFNIPVQVQTCLYMVLQVYHFKFCQILPGFGKYLCWYILVCTILRYIRRPLLSCVSELSGLANDPSWRGMQYKHGEKLLEKACFKLFQIKARTCRFLLIFRQIL